MDHFLNQHRKYMINDGSLYYGIHIPYHRMFDGRIHVSDLGQLTSQLCHSNKILFL